MMGADDPSTESGALDEGSERPIPSQLFVKLPWTWPSLLQRIADKELGLSAGNHIAALSGAEGALAEAQWTLAEAARAVDEAARAVDEAARAVHEAARALAEADDDPRSPSASTGGDES